jgi:hypothetical protein
MRTQPIEKYGIFPIKLWSLLQSKLAACGQTKGSPQQWIGTIRNLQKKGVSAVEIQWSDILLNLDEHPPELALHLDDLLAYLNVKPPCELVLQRHITDEYVPLVRYEKQQRPATLPPVLVRNGRREVRLLHYMDRTFGLCIWLHVDVDAELFGRHRYWSFSVPRGRKKLALEPIGRRFVSAPEAMAHGRVLVERMARRLAAQGFVGQARNLNRWTRFALPGGEHYTEWLITAPNLSVQYWGEHFELANIVAHVRTTERMTPQGARLLVLEEIQSDWNQALRKAIQEAKERHPADAEERDLIEWDDDMDPPPDSPYLNHWLEAALRMMFLLAANQDFSGVAWLPGKLHMERFPSANADGLKMFYDRIVPAAVEKLAKSWGARLDSAQFSTLSRQFDVRKLNGKAEWQVFNVTSRKVVGENFATYEAAEAFRRLREDAVVEHVSALYLYDEMRSDIRQNGLPYLGAVGMRRSRRPCEAAPLVVKPPASEDFNELTYLKFQPMFAAAIAEAGVVGDIKESMRAVIRIVKDAHGIEAVKNMQPYIVRYMQDVRDGKVVYEQNSEVAGNGLEQRGNTDLERDC